MSVLNSIYNKLFNAGQKSPQSGKDSMSAFPVWRNPFYHQYNAHIAPTYQQRMISPYVLAEYRGIPSVLSSLLSLSRLSFPGYDVKFESIDGPEDDSKGPQIKEASREFKRLDAQIGRIDKSRKVGTLGLIRYAALESWTYKQSLFQFAMKQDGQWLNPVDIQALPGQSFARPAAQVTSDFNRYIPDKILPGIVYDYTDDVTRFFQSQRVGEAPVELDPDTIIYIEDSAMPEGMSMMKSIIPIIEHMREADTDGMLALHRVGVPNQIASVDPAGMELMSKMDPSYSASGVMAYMQDLVKEQGNDTATVALGGMKLQYPNISMPLNPWQVEEALEKKIIDFWFHRNILEMQGRAISHSSNPMKDLLDVHIASEREVAAKPFERWWNEHWLAENGFDLVLKFEWHNWAPDDLMAAWEAQRSDFQVGALDINEYRQKRNYGPLDDKGLEDLIKHHNELTKGSAGSAGNAGGQGAASGMQEEGGKITQSAKILNFNPDHVPAGSSEGGQFASKDGGDGGNAPKVSLSDIEKAYEMYHSTQEKINNDAEKIKNVRNITNASKLAKQVFDDHGLSVAGEDLSAADIATLREGMLAHWNDRAGFINSLKETNDLFTESRLAGIFDNETHVAFGEANRDIAMTDGKKQKTWVVTGSDNMCPECEAMSGDTANIDEPYSNGMMIAQAHIGCQCEDKYS